MGFSAGSGEERVAINIIIDNKPNQLNIAQYEYIHRYPSAGHSPTLLGSSQNFRPSRTSTDACYPVNHRREQVSATEKSHQTCLPPEAYLRIIRRLPDDTAPKIRSTVYPTKQTNQNGKNK